MIKNNDIRNIFGNRSTKGITIGDAASTNPSENVKIIGNSITNITSAARGAYGISLNNGNGATSNSGLEIRNNTISNLTSGTACGSSTPPTNAPCGWVHAIGRGMGTGDEGPRSFVVETG